MASSSRRTTAEKQKAPSSVFRPKFPIDPFAAAAVREPWFVHPDAWPPSNIFTRRDVLLILGAPSARDLHPFLSSKHLSNSLLIIATHQPPVIPHTSLPTVRVLRLKAPLAIEQAGAVRFVNVLEWAERVARLWRKYGGYGAAELFEDNDGQDYLTPPSLLRFKSSQSTPNSPASSTGDLTSLRASASSTPENQTKSRSGSVTSRILNKARQLALPAVDPSQRPFDGLVNFLPRDVSDKALLKQAILATTISRPFLISSAPRRDEKRRSRLSSRSSTSVYMPPTPPYLSGDSLSSLMFSPTRPHLIHVLPVETRLFNSFARSKLVQSLESFLLSFGYPTSFTTPDDTDRPRPYIMTSSSLGVIVSPSESASTSASPYSWPSDCSLAELVLCGSLDGEDPHSTPMRAHARAPPRALLTRATDVVLLTEDAPAPPAVAVSYPEPTYQSIGFPSASGNRPMPVLRHSSLPSTSPSTLSSSPSGRSNSPGSPLARGDRYGKLGYLPTPPDSDESGPDSPVDVSIMSQLRADKALPAPPIVTVTELVHTGEGMVKKARWKFWRRSRAISR